VVNLKQGINKPRKGPGWKLLKRSSDKRRRSLGGTMGWRVGINALGYVLYHSWNHLLMPWCGRLRHFFAKYRVLPSIWAKYPNKSQSIHPNTPSDLPEWRSIWGYLIDPYEGDALTFKKGVPPSRDRLVFEVVTGSVKDAWINPVFEWDISTSCIDLNDLHILIVRNHHLDRL
jgi:hypothetical protein